MLISVQSIDVGQALEALLYDDNTAGQTYELYGPKEYSTAEIAALVDREIFKKRTHINLPKRILKPLAGLLNKVLWWPVLSAEDVEREFFDQQIDETAKTFADLGITPGELSNFTYHYLVRFICIAIAKSTILTACYSKDTVAHLTTTSPRQQRRRSRKTKSIFM